MSEDEKSIIIDQKDAEIILNDEKIALETQNFQKCYMDILTIINKYTVEYPLSKKALYWYQEAQKINDPSNSSDAKTFIRDVATTGNLLSGHTLDTQAVSNAIANNVAKTVASGQILGINELLGTDAYTAFSEFNVTIGGWGGSFYYWNTNLFNKEAGINFTPGSEILKNVPYAGASYDMGGEYDKFLASNSYGMYQVINTQGPWTVVLNGLESIIGKGAELPYRQTYDLVARVLEERDNNSPIVGDPNAIDQYQYDSSTGKWFTTNIKQNIGFGSSLSGTYVTDATTTKNLNSEREYRESHSNITIDNAKKFEDSNTIPSSQSNTKNNETSQSSIYIDNNKNLEETTFTPASGSEDPFNSLTQTETNANGLTFLNATQETLPGQISPENETIALMDSSKKISMSEVFSNIDPETGQKTDNLNLFEVSLFNTGVSNNENSNINYITGVIENGSLQNETVLYKDGSSVEHIFKASKYWEEMKINSSGIPTSDISYGETTDPNTGNTVVGTTVTNETTFAQTFFKNGDPNAPGMILSPSELLSMAGLKNTWDSLYQKGLTGNNSDYSGGSSSIVAGAASTTAIAVTDTSHHNLLGSIMSGNQSLFS